MKKALILFLIVCANLSHAQNSMADKKAAVFYKIIDIIQESQHFNLDTFVTVGLIALNEKEFTMSIGTMGETIVEKGKTTDLSALNKTKVLINSKFRNAAFKLYNLTDTPILQRGMWIHHDAFLNSQLEPHHYSFNKFYFEIEKPLEGWEYAMLYSQYRFYLKRGQGDLSFFIKNYNYKILIPVYYWLSVKGKEIQKQLIFEFSIVEDKNNSVGLNLIYKSVKELY